MNDLVEHTRTVHLTLMLTAFIVLVAATQDKQRPLLRAADDAKAILDLQPKEWTLLDAIRKQAESQHQSRPNHLSSGLYRITVGGKDILFAVKDGWFFNYALAPSERKRSADEGYVERPELALIPAIQWSNLAFFSEYWDISEQLDSLDTLQPGPEPDGCPLPERVGDYAAAANFSASLTVENQGIALSPVLLLNPEIFGKVVCRFKTQRTNHLNVPVREMLRSAVADPCLGVPETPTTNSGT
jgi:hypothetical protein